MVCITFLIVLLQILNLSIYPDSRNLIQVDLKHSKCNCELVLLQANIKSTWNLDRLCVLHFSLPYSMDKSCPSTQNLGWNLNRWRLIHFSMSYFRYSSCPSTVGYNSNNGSKWMIFIRIGYVYYSVGCSVLGSILAA